MLWFGFVSGHDFSRAAKGRKEVGLQPLLPLPGKEKTQGLKPRSVLGLSGTD
jgi:hypothetical protein